MWTFPVILAEKSSDHGHVIDRRNPLDEWHYLDALAAGSELVDIEFGDYEFTGYVDDLLLAQNASTKMLNDWGCVGACAGVE